MYIHMYIWTWSFYPIRITCSALALSTLLTAIFWCWEQNMTHAMHSYIDSPGGIPPSGVSRDVVFSRARVRSLMSVKATLRDWPIPNDLIELWELIFISFFFAWSSFYCSFRLSHSNHYLYKLFLNILPFNQIMIFW